MNTFLWILAGITAAAFLMAGAMKLITPREKLKEMMAWVGDVSPGLVKFMGVAEILGAMGLILPPLLGVAEILTPIAATGLTLAMLGAMTLHLRRGNEGQMIMANLILGLMAAVIAWGRFGPEPF